MLHTPYLSTSLTSCLDLAFFPEGLSQPPAMNAQLRGISYILVSGIFLAINDAVAKSLVPYYPPGQILFTIGIAVTVVIWMILRFHLKTGVQINHWPSHLLRGVLFAIASFAFVVSLKFLPLAEVICIAFAGPLFMTLMAKTILHEQVGIHRLGAVIVGFIGVVIIIQPGGTEFEWIVLLPLVVAIGDAGRDTLTRKMAPTESSLCIVMTTSATLAVISFFTVFLGWVKIEQQHLWRFALSTILTVGSYFFMVEAFRHAQTVVIAPFRYIQIVWGILLGIIFWEEIPKGTVYIGVALTIASGVYIAIREARSSDSIES